MDADDAILCYVSEDRAYFTTQKLYDQWGDDWEDAPYEHNAGHPYTPSWIDKRDGRRWEVYAVWWAGPFLLPCERHNGRNSPWSVRRINSGDTPWLLHEDWPRADVKVMAGATLRAFREAVIAAGGAVSIATKEPDDYDEPASSHRV